jgi:hypothetical protein
MRIDREFYLLAQNFIESNLPLTSGIYSIPLGYGHTNFRAPAIYVTIPSASTDDHTESFFALFHEYGHWLEMESWIKANATGGDSRSCALQYNDYLETIGVLGTPGMPEKKDSVLRSERNVRLFGRDGLQIGSCFHKGLRDFDAQHSDPQGKLLQLFEDYSDKMYQTYVQSSE